MASKSNSNILTRIKIEDITDRRDSSALDYTSKTPKTSIAEQQTPTMSTTSTFTLLDQQAEDELHPQRLLNIEQNPFKRVQKRLLQPTNPIHEFLRRTPTEEVVSEPEEPSSLTEDSSLKTLSVFQQSTLHDFTSLIHSLARLQFLLNSNAAERTRYAAQASTITAQHSTIRAETTALRTRLSHAREQLQVRKGYDVHAEKVLWVDGRVGGVKSKTREELGRESEKLRAEIEELEREGDELNAQWVERRMGLGEVKVHTARLRRVVRGEVEVELGQDEESEDEQGRDEEDETGHVLGGSASQVGTPVDAGTPLPTILEPETETESVAGALMPDVDHEMEASTPEFSGSGLKHEIQREPSADVDMAESNLIEPEMPDEAEKAGLSEVDEK